MEFFPRDFRKMNVPAVHGIEGSAKQGDFPGLGHHA